MHNRQMVEKRKTTDRSGRRRICAATKAKKTGGDKHQPIGDLSMKKENNPQPRLGIFYQKKKEGYVVYKYVFKR